jgi:hypothetical protein
MTKSLPNALRVFNYRRSGGVTRAAKGADCKSAGLRLRRFESYLLHHASPLRLRVAQPRRDRRGEARPA